LLRDAQRPERGPGSLGAREFLLVLGGAFVLAAVMFWPLPLHLSRDIAHNTTDPLLQAWTVAWVGHALEHQLSFWDANILFPNGDSLAFSESLAGYAPVGLIGEGVGAAVARYNLLFLFAYALAVAGAYALGRELGLSRAAALVAGVAFAYSPWRWAQAGHLHIVASGAIPLSLALLVRGYRLGRPRAIVGGWLVVSWQVLIGLSLGLMLCYLLALLSAFVLVRWLRTGRPPVPRPIVFATAGGVAAVLAASVLVVPPYLRVADAHPEARRSLEQLRRFSPPLAGVVVAPTGNTVWGDLTEGVRSHFDEEPEQVLFPGLATIALAMVGLVTGVFSRRLRWGLAVGALLAFLFSLGTTLLDGRLTYRLLYDYAPGWSGIRTPGRLHTLTTLALAMLAGAGLQSLAERSKLLRFPRHRVALATAAVAAVIVLAEGASWQLRAPGAGVIAGPSHPTVPRAPVGLAEAREPLVHIPPSHLNDFFFMIWSTDRFPRIVNGSTGFDPRKTVAIKDTLETFPDKRSITALRRAAVRTVVFHRSFAQLEPEVETRPLDRLGVVRRPVGEVVLFELR